MTIECLHEDLSGTDCYGVAHRQHNLDTCLHQVVTQAALTYVLLLGSLVCAALVYARLIMLTILAVFLTTQLRLFAGLTGIEHRYRNLMCQQELCQLRCSYWV